ncbi:MAG: class I SAM-dependent methyltransferase [Arenicellales bacterium]|nr:class I SAM-dependent methyltransferase [Arenicellales bacterium]
MEYTSSNEGIFKPSIPVQHRDEEYDQARFATLSAMQDKHFWYRGRRRFLLAAVDRYLPQTQDRLAAIDLGGGVGGWTRYLSQERQNRFTELALGDSSEVALTMAAGVLPPDVARYQIDLLNLGWTNRWDAAFLLDVIEHLPDPAVALAQTVRALKPGGVLFVTTPAFQQFWSFHDDLAHHQRRYVRKDFELLAENVGLKFIDARYFMFFLSPLYILTRITARLSQFSEDKKRELTLKQRAIPSTSINSVLSLIFSAETPLGHWLKFPWGTSILGVFQKKESGPRSSDRSGSGKRR